MCRFRLLERDRGHFADARGVGAVIHLRQGRGAREQNERPKRPTYPPAKPSEYPFFHIFNVKISTAALAAHTTGGKRKNTTASHIKNMNPAASTPARARPKRNLGEYLMKNRQANRPKNCPNATRNNFCG
jgi:hypothetical protein